MIDDDGKCLECGKRKPCRCYYEGPPKAPLAPEMVGPFPAPPLIGARKVISVAEALDPYLPESREERLAALIREAPSLSDLRRGALVGFLEQYSKWHTRAMEAIEEEE